MAGLYRRGKVYWGRVQRQNREHRRSLQTTDRTVAEKRLRQWVDDLQAIAWGDKPRRTFAEAAQRFIHEHLITLKPGGAKRYGVSLKSLAVHFGGMTLDQIGSASLSDFETKRRTQGVSSPTIRRDLACLSSIFASATDWEWIDDGSNPVPSFLKRRSKRGLKESPARTRYLSEDEEAKILEASTASTRLAVILAIDTGLRREELFSLKWEQVDQRRGLICTTTMTKSGRKRYVPLPPRSAHLLAHQPRFLRSPYVLCHEDGSRFVQMNKGLAGACRRANIKGVRWHDLRRTAGCRWLQRDDRTMLEVSVMLGHSSVNVTEARYAFLESERVASSVGRRQSRDAS